MCTYTENGLREDHPRSSMTDDVECFFSLLRDLVGQNFTLKVVQHVWRKICAEITIRQNPDLPFFFHTCAHGQFYEKEREFQPASGGRIKEKFPKEAPSSC